MIEGLSLAAVFLAGLISFVSPCVLPLVPVWLCYMAGNSLESIAAKDATASMRASVLMPAISFVLGFSLIFVMLGATASAMGNLLRAHLQTLSILAGLAVIAMGLHFLGVFRIALLNREARFRAEKAQAGTIGAFVMGLAFAFGWTPCIGPVLGAVLAVAGARESVAQGSALLAIYSAGLGVPFILSALFLGAFMGFAARFRNCLDKIEKLMGILLILAGIAFLTGTVQRVSFWLLETFPALGRIG